MRIVSKKKFLKLTHALLALLSSTILISGTAHSQLFEEISVEQSCSFTGEEFDFENVIAFKSNDEAIDVIDDIVKVSGLARNFDIRSAGVPNASASVKNGKRYILYNVGFIQDMYSRTGTKWAAISIMAHEVGHHLNAHTFDGLGSRPNKELEADYYSGFIVQKLGATLKEAQVAMRVLAGEKGSFTHPGRNDRLAAIASGWSEACELDPTCSTFGKTVEPDPIIKDKVPSAKLPEKPPVIEPNENISQRIEEITKKIRDAWSGGVKKCDAIAITDAQYNQCYDSADRSTLSGLHKTQKCIRAFDKTENLCVARAYQKDPNFQTTGINASSYVECSNTSNEYIDHCAIDEIRNERSGMRYKERSDIERPCKRTCTTQRETCESNLIAQAAGR